MYVLNNLNISISGKILKYENGDFEKFFPIPHILCDVSDSINAII